MSNSFQTRVCCIQPVCDDRFPQRGGWRFPCTPSQAAEVICTLLLLLFSDSAIKGHACTCGQLIMEATLPCGSWNILSLLGSANDSAKVPECRLLACWHKPSMGGYSIGWLPLSQMCSWHGFPVVNRLRFLGCCKPLRQFSYLFSVYFCSLFSLHENSWILCQDSLLWNTRLEVFEVSLPSHSQTHFGTIYVWFSSAQVPRSSLVKFSMLACLRNICS